MGKKVKKNPHTITVTILDKNNAIKYIPPIRKWTKRAISEIKKQILNEEFVLRSEYNIDTQSLIELKKQICELESLGATVKITMNVDDYSEVIDLAAISTLIKRNLQTEKEIEEIWDLETREDDDSE